MDFIYSRLNNNLVDINRIKSITLFKCTQDDEPIAGIKAGYFYLEVEVIDSDRKVYCDLSDFIDNRLPIPNQTDIAKVLTVGEDGKYQLSDTPTPINVYTKEEADEKFLSEVKASDVNSETATQGQVLTADGSGGANWQNVSGGTILNKYTFYANAPTSSQIWRLANILANAKGNIRGYIQVRNYNSATNKNTDIAIYVGACDGYTQTGYVNFYGIGHSYQSDDRNGDYIVIGSIGQTTSITGFHRKNDNSIEDVTYSLRYIDIYYYNDTEILS